MDGVVLQAASRLACSPAASQCQSGSAGQLVAWVEAIMRLRPAVGAVGLISFSRLPSATDLMRGPISPASTFCSSALHPSPLQA